MINNYLILKSQAEYLDKILPGFRISEIYSTDKNIINIILDKGVYQYCLLVSFERNFESLVLLTGHSRPKKNITVKLDGCHNKNIESIAIKNDDRIIFINFSDSSQLALIFVPNNLNILFIKENQINETFYNNSELKQYENVEKYFDDINKKTVKPQDIISEIAYQYKLFLPQYVKEINEIAKRDKIDTDDKIAVENLIKKYYEVNFTNPEYLIYYHHNNYITSLKKLDGLNFVESFNDINSLIKYYIFYLRNKIKNRNEKHRYIESIRNSYRNLIHKIDNLKNNLNSIEKTEENKLKGDLLYLHMNEIQKGDTVLECNYEGRNFVIKINPELGVPDNAAKYYNKYKGEKKSLSILIEKIKALESEKKDMEIKIKEAEGEESEKLINKLIKKDKKQMEIDKLPFRKFKLDDTYSVWVGKNSTANDLLTMKYTNQYEYWFHVRGASGSHTVLKFDDKNNVPDKNIISKAASIAAYFSKARNAKHIPVAYTQRKYVKKKKGFKEGSVIMEKEKVIFVDPSLPFDEN